MKSVFFLLLGVFCLATTSLSAQNGAEQIDFDFAFTADDGCGPYDVSGTGTVTFTNGGVRFKYQGTAVEQATGDVSPLNVTLVENGNRNSFTQVLSVTFPSEVSVTSVFHVNLKGPNGVNGINFVSNSKVNCK